MEPLLKNLEKQVTCSICLDRYTEPKTISCLHTFCCVCLEEHARRNHKQGKFRCPECQAEIDLPEGNRFDRLPNSFFHKSLLGLLAAEDYEASLKPREPFCLQHKREIARCFCFSCEACICTICMAEDHRNHEFELLTKAAHKEKTYIMSSVETIKEKANMFRAVIGKFEKTCDDVEIIIAIAKQKVSQAAEHMIAKIRQQEEQLLQSLEVTRRKRLERINSAKKEVESLMKQMNQAAEFAENLVQRSSSTDIMQNKKTLKQKFEELRGVQVPKHHQTTVAKFNAACRVEDVKLGFIETTEYKADASKSTLDGLDQTLQAGVEAELTLSPKSAEGKMSSQADLKDHVEFLIEPANDVRNVIVTEKEDGNLQLKFTPKVPGAYSIEVKINGDKLPNCPFTVQAKERELVVVGELELKLFPGDTFRRLFGIAVNKKGEIAVTDNIGHCLYVFDKDGSFLRKKGRKGENPGEFLYPNAVSYLNDTEVLIADCWNHRIQQVGIQTGTVVKSFGKYGAGKGEFMKPYDVCLDDEARIVVTELGNNRIQVMSKEGESILTFGDSGPEKLNNPTSCLPYKNVFLVSDEDNHCIKAFDQSGTYLYKFGKQGNQDGQFNCPHGMLVDINNNLLVCDNNRVQQFSLDGRFTGKSITRIPTPFGIATTPDGRILVTSGAAKKVYILR